MSDFWLNCDSCGRQNVGVTFVNGMRFCAKCYQETFGASKDWQLLDKDKTIAEQRKQIADLEAKLAEKDLRIEELESQFAYECECNKQFVDCQNENNQLKQQLAEKEKELKYYETLLKRQCNECKNQGKISFCIERLNYLRDIIDNRVDEYLQSHDMDNYNCFVTHQGMYSCFEILVQEIDNQIKQLKEGK